MTLIIIATLQFKPNGVIPFISTTGFSPDSKKELKAAIEGCKKLSIGSSDSDFTDSEGMKFTGIKSLDDDDESTDFEPSDFEP